ncbi:MAG TPA: hypothetical protein VME66_03020, partial [Candidatus Acidoferrales bacterium]|nr:hypothetical protein [Candidatus Acidoferrales bacterium]
QASSLVITDDGSLSTNNWATYTYGLNAAPVDSLNGSNTTYVYSGGSGFASGTYPSMTAGYTKFVATVGASTNYVCTPGSTGTITYNVTVK